MGCYARRGVAERFKAAALETVVCAKRTVDSNPTPSAENPFRHLSSVVALEQRAPAPHVSLAPARLSISLARREREQLVPMPLRPTGCHLVVLHPERALHSYSWTRIASNNLAS